MDFELAHEILNISRLLEAFRLVQMINCCTIEGMSQKMMHLGTKNAILSIPIDFERAHEILNISWL